MAQEIEELTDALRRPLCDKRHYRSLRLRNGVRALVVSDPEATFGACCANVQAGYFDDPDSLPGLAHFLEHAVHLGSEKYPQENGYKMYLSQHAGSSNASTSMVHTQFHFTCKHDHMQGAVDRMAQFFVAPLIASDAVAREVNAVHAEFSRNTNSDQRKLLQLRRSAGQRPYSGFSTGNISTLWEAPLEQGVEMDRQLRQLWERCYTGGMTTVALVAPQSLDELESMVLSSFEGVRPTPEGTAGATCTSEGELPLGARYAVEGDVCGAMGTYFKVAPKRHLRSLELVWFLPRGLHHDTASKPWRWVSHMLGTEVRGSVACHLKRRGWLQELSTGTADEVKLGRGFAFWRCSMELTQEGEEHVDEIVAAVYQGIELLKSAPVEKRSKYFEELKALNTLSFDWRAREKPLDYAKKLAARLHYHPADQVLFEPEVVQEEDWDAVDRVLAELRPANMNVFHVSPGFEALGGRLEEERWYGARFAAEPLPASMLAAIQVSLEAGASELRLPEPNWAIPANFDMLPAAESPTAAPPQRPAAKGHSKRRRTLPRTPPELLQMRLPAGANVPTCMQDDATCRMWHQQDTSFDMPKAAVYFHLLSPAVNESARSAAATRLLVMALERELEPTLYHAHLASSSAHLGWNSAGLTVHFKGFSDVLPRMVPIVAELLATVSEETLAEHLPVVKGEMQQSLNNWRHNAPASHVAYHARHLLIQPFWHAEDLLAAVGAISAADLRSHLSAIKSRCCIEALCYGNLTASGALHLAGQLCEPLRVAPLHACDAPERRVLCLSERLPRWAVDADPAVRARAAQDEEEEEEEEEEDGEGAAPSVAYFPANPDPANPDSAVQLSVQLGVLTPEQEVLLVLFAQMASKPCFHQLRTVEQLGYSVSSGVMHMEEVAFFRVTVQSPQKGPAELTRRITAWLTSFRSHLADMTPQRFDNNIASLSAKYREPPKTLWDAASRMWNEVSDRSYCFDRRDRMAAAVKAATKAHVLQLYDRHISPRGSHTALLTVNIQGSGAEGGEQAGPGDGRRESRGLHNVAETTMFQSSRPMFPSRVNLAPKARL
eukprot:jgi/Tetstr1/425488/TSEL_015935.t1